MPDLKLHQGEGKPLQLTYTNTLTKKPVDLTGACMSLIMRAAVGGTEILRKDDSEFTKGLASDGIVGFTLSTEETNITPGLYYVQARAHFSSTNTPLTLIYEVEILPSLFDLVEATGLLDGKVTITT